MKLVIVSGRSGSGKTTALQALEDIGYYCVDNLPVGLLPELAQQITDSDPSDLQMMAVGIDARNVPSQLEKFPHILKKIKLLNVDSEIIFLDCEDRILLQRFSATRRKHPLTNENVPLSEAINSETGLLSAIATLADLHIDTSHLTLHQLRDLIKTRIGQTQHQGIALLFQSFGFKHGVPSDADFVFDVRCLPNPYWHTELRSLTGKDQEVIKFLYNEKASGEMIKDIEQFVAKWLVGFLANNRTYMTIAIGCTGGQHRSVYVAEQLKAVFQQQYHNVQVRHRELS